MKFRHSGDLGDILAALGVIRHFPNGPHDLFFVDRNIVPPRTNPLCFRAEVLAPLIRVQPYIKSCVCSEEHVDLDFSHFRAHYQRTHSLQWSQFEYAKVRFPELTTNRGVDPWLFVEPDEKFKGRVIVARSPRYNNPLMPWQRIVEKYGERILFVGIDAEYTTFCSAFGNVERLVVENYLDLARAMAGAELFIGNQSSPYNIAEGLKIRRILEVAPANCDCIYLGGDVRWMTDGSVSLPDLDGGPDEPVVPDVKNIDENTVPPGSWQYPGCVPCMFFNDLVRQIASETKCTRDEARQKLIAHNVARLPKFFRKEEQNQYFAIAYENAKAA
jgi:hypothetical protein